MHRRIVITGPSCSGKTTLAKAFSQLGYVRILTYTTRPPRPEEKNQVDYNFVSQKTFDHLSAIGFFDDVTTYDTVYGKWSYGLPNLYKICTADCVMVLNAEGAMKMLNKAFVIFLDPSEHTLRERHSFRGMIDDEEFNRRLAADKPKFERLHDMMYHPSTTDVLYIPKDDVDPQKLSAGLAYGFLTN